MQQPALIDISSAWERFVEMPNEIFQEIISKLKPADMVSLYIAAASNPTMRERLNPHILIALNRCTPQALFTIVQDVRASYSPIYAALETAWLASPSDLPLTVCYAFVTANINALTLDKMLVVATQMRSNYPESSAIQRVIKSIVTALIYKRDFATINQITEEVASYDVNDVPRNNYFRISRCRTAERTMTRIAFPTIEGSGHFINLSSAFLENVYFDYKNISKFFILENANLRGCFFKGIDFKDIVIRNTDLANALFVDVRGSLNLAGTNLSGTEFISVLSCLTVDYQALATALNPRDRLANLSNQDDVKFKKRIIELPLVLNLKTLHELDQYNNFRQELNEEKFVALQNDLAIAVADRLAELYKAKVDIAPLYHLARQLDCFKSNAVYPTNIYTRLSGYVFHFFTAEQSESPAQRLLEQRYNEIVHDQSSKIKLKQD